MIMLIEKREQPRHLKDSNETLQSYMSLIVVFVAPYKDLNNVIDSEKKESLIFEKTLTLFGTPTYKLKDF